MTAAETLISALDGNRRTGMCFCPAHDDSTPSLKVSERDGKVLFYCHAGCSQQQVMEALKSLGLSWSSRHATRAASTVSRPIQLEVKLEQQEADKFRQEAYPILRTAAKAAHLGAGRYRGPVDYLRNRGIEVVPASAMLLPSEQACTLGNRIAGFKSYPAMVLPICGANGLQGASITFLSRDGNKNLRSTTGKNIRRIYGAIKGGYVQLGNIDPDNPPETVIVAEGIETALSASQLTGFPAIAVLGADNYASIAPPACAELLIAADNDEQGLEKARAAAALWAANGRSVRIAIPPEHKDWNDALRDRNADREQLAQLLLRAKRVTANGVARALSMQEIMQLELPQPEYLLKPWLRSSSINMLHAQRGHGKSRLMMSVAYALASGQDFLAWEVKRRARVLYVDGELPAQLLQERVKVLGPTATGLLFLSRDILLQGGIVLPDLGQEEGRQFLDQIIEREKVELIVLDSLSTLIRSGVENEAESWSPVQDWLMQHRFHGRSTVLIHHEGRSGQPRGTSKREDTLDSILRLKELADKEGDEQHSSFELSFTKSREFHGAAKAPLILRLSTASGSAEWSYEKAIDHTRERIKELHSQGMKQKHIAKEVGLSQTRVSRILASVADAVAVLEARKGKS